MNRCRRALRRQEVGSGLRAMHVNNAVANQWRDPTIHKDGSAAGSMLGQWAQHRSGSGSVFLDCWSIRRQQVAAAPLVPYSLSEAATARQAS